MRLIDTVAPGPDRPRAGTGSKGRHGRRSDAGATAEVRPQVITSAEFLRKRSTRIGLAAVFIAALGIYTATCARTVTGEDSGELIAAAYTLGVAHPPGYPLWCLLGKLFTFLPVGEIAFRVAFISAFFGALTVTTLAAVGLVLSRSWLIALVSGFGFGLLRDQWSQAVIAEVYTLNSFLLAASLLLLLLWSERRSWRLLNLFALAFGLGLSNHPTFLAAAGPFFVFLLVKGFRLLIEWRRILVATGWFALGFVPYLYLPLSALSDPEINWGDPSSISATIDHIARRQYTENAAVPLQTWDRFQDQMGVLVDHATSQGATPFLALGLVALVLLARRRFSHFLALGGLAAFSTIVLILYTNSNTDFENAYAGRLFSVPAYLALAVAAVYLLRAVQDRLPRRIATPALAVLAAVLVGQPLFANFGTCDYSEYRLVSDYARRLLASVDQKAVLIPSSDHNTFPLHYLKFVEGLRPDVTLADKYGYIDPPVYEGTEFESGFPPHLRRTRAFRHAAEAWIVRTWNRPVYFSQKGSIIQAPEFEMVPEGMWFRARKKDAAPEDTRYDDLKAWLRIEKVPFDGNGAAPFDYTARMVLSDTDFAQARRAFGEGRTVSALEACRRGPTFAPGAKEIQNNFASLLAENGCHEKAWPLFRRALALDPGYEIARRNLGISLRAAGRIDEACAVFHEILARDRADPVANRALGEIARKASNWQEAAHYLTETGRVTGDPDAFRDAGLIHLFELKDDLALAKALLRTSLRINPDQPEIADVESRIKPKDEEQAKDKSDGEEDHSKHDCIKKGCEAKRLIADGTKAKELDLPSPPDPIRAARPKLPDDVPDPFETATPVPATPARGMPRPGTGRGSAPARPPAPPPRHPGRRSP